MTKYWVFAGLVLAGVLGYFYSNDSFLFVSSPTAESTKSEQAAAQSITQTQSTQTNTNLDKHESHDHAKALTSAQADAAGHHHGIDESKLRELIDKHMTPAMKAEINEMLMPGGAAPEVRPYGDSYIVDTSDRASTVMIAIIDEEEGLIVTDITQPLPQLKDTELESAQEHFSNAQENNKY